MIDTLFDRHRTRLVVFVTLFSIVALIGWTRIEFDNEAKALAEDMKWMWKSWAVPFGQPFPELLFGSPDTLCRRIEEVSAAVPLNEIFLIIPQGIHNRDQVLSSLELFAEKVITKFN